jgi:hypothetical protein
MKFFTRNWLGGDMSDEQANAIAPAYRRHLETLDLPQPLRDLVALNPHDARILGVDHDPSANTLTVRLRGGDLQAGYFDARLHFAGVSIRPADAAALARAGVEILYDEVDRPAPGGYEYRLLLHPTGEVAFHFNNVAIARHPVTDRRAALR